MSSCERLFHGKTSVSWDIFPCYIHDHTKNLLVERTASHLKHKKFTTVYGGSLTSSSGRILLQSIPGAELYRERLVRALARDLQVHLLVFDTRVLAQYDSGEDCSSENELEDNVESGEESTSESEIEDENDTSNEEDTSSGESRSDASDDEVDARPAAEALTKLAHYNHEEFEKNVSGESESSSASSKLEGDEASDQGFCVAGKEGRCMK